MSEHFVDLPKVTRPDAGTILVSPWKVGDSARQASAVDATIAEWEQAPKPDAFLTLNCFTSLDGELVLNYAQWTSDAAHREFVREHRPALVREIDSTVPDIERPGLVRYRLYRSVGSGAAAVGRPSIVSVAVYQVDGHDRARQLADALADVYGSCEGMASCHFHADADGTRLLVFVAWRDEPAHEAFAASSAGQAAWAIVDGYPHCDPLGYRLYRLHRKLEHHPAPSK